MNLVDISERYRKYLIRINYLDRKYYSIWGTDIKDNYTDKVIVEKGLFLLFKDITLLKNYLLANRALLFDSQNTVEWLFAISDIEEYNHYLFPTNGEVISSKDCLNLLNLIQDYAEQANDNELLSLMTNDIYKAEYDQLTDGEIWGNKSDTPDTVPLFYTIFDLFYSRCKVID